MNRINITVTNGTFTYPIDMKDVQVEHYAYDNSFCIASGGLASTQPIATEQDYQELISPEDRANKEIAIIEDAIDVLIQDEIDKYNKANGVKFKDINAIAKYVLVPTYNHFAFCDSVLKWNVAVWEEARRLQGEIFAGNIPKPTTVEEFIAMLPKRV